MKLEWKPASVLAPVPAVLVTCRGMTETGKRDNVFTVAWTGTVNTSPAMTFLSVRKERFSYGLIKASGVFAINLTTSKLAFATDFCGVKSARETDKFEAAKLTAEQGRRIDCPILRESPVVLECRVKSVTPLGTHDMFLAEIVGVDVEESLVDSSGKLHLENANLLAYAHGEYFELGRRLGKFGFSVKKPVKKR